MDISAFFSSGSTATLTNSISSFLGISADRIRVVNVRKGSAIVDFSIIPDSSSSNTNTSSQNEAELKTLQTKLDTGVTGGSLNLSSIAPVTGYTSKVHVVPDTIPKSAGNPFTRSE